MTLALKNTACGESLSELELSGAYTFKAGLKLYTTRYHSTKTYQLGKQAFRVNALALITEESRLQEYAVPSKALPTSLSVAASIAANFKPKVSEECSTYILRKEKYSFINALGEQRNLLRKLSKVNTTRLVNEFAFSTAPNSTPRSKAAYGLLSTQGTYLPTKSDLGVRRVRFKPGYQVMWRSARTALSKAIGLNFRYQKKLTRYLTFFYRVSHSSGLALPAPSASHVLLGSKLLPDENTVNTFISKKYIFLNGLQLTRSNLTVCKGDCLQLTVSRSLISYGAWLRNWHNDKSNKLRLFAQLKLGHGSARSEGKYRVRSKHLPLKILKYINFSTYIPSFLEVDFFSTSVVLVGTNLGLSPSSGNKLFTKSNIIKNYNWKYLN